MTQKKKQGRPVNTQIETNFMEAIRPIKLPTINAESKMELELALYGSAEQKTKKVNGTSPENKKKAKESIEKLWKSKLIANGFPEKECNQLMKNFDIIKNSWQFEEIKEEKMPKYFFDDGCDVSFILHELMVKQDSYSPRSTFTELELLFVELACLNQRGELTELIVNQLDVQAILKLLKIAKQEIPKHYKKTLNEKKKENSDSSQEQNEQEKTKYKKQQKTKSKKEVKQEKIKDKEIDEDDPQNKGRPKDKIHYLALKIAKHIGWAYRYIYQEQYERAQNFN